MCLKRANGKLDKKWGEEGTLNMHEIKLRRWLLLLSHSKGLWANGVVVFGDCHKLLPFDDNTIDCDFLYVILCEFSKVTMVVILA